MSRSLRRGAIAATALAFSIATLAACGAGNDAQTLGVRPDNAATSIDDGKVKIQNALVITQPDREASGPAAVSATIFNNGTTDQTLEAVKVDGTEDAKLKPAKGGSLTIPAGGSLVLGGKNNATAMLADSEKVTHGDAHKVTFTLSETGDVTMTPFVVPATSYFAEWGPEEVPEAPAGGASESATPSGSASGEPTEGASGEPTDGASESAGGHGAEGEPTDGTSESSASH
ncbi:copper chaperone PCu(A)C [Streptomyces indicus]|uniref:Copper(I)-binding protein n=1 Tax=Streptomyces indicus TaxID=417292 RepID=A0A1G9H885_9ACTN|nr:copper chaperone PCu(A)C [Streptomyces indicus]SDL09077.1 Protein of unknown function [Streptomyces indicus]